MNFHKNYCNSSIYKFTINIWFIALKYISNNNIYRYTENEKKNKKNIIKHNKYKTISNYMGRVTSY